MRQEGRREYSNRADAAALCKYWSNPVYPFAKQVPHPRITKTSVSRATGAYTSWECLARIRASSVLVRSRGRPAARNPAVGSLVPPSLPRALRPAHPQPQRQSLAPPSLRARPRSLRHSRAMKEARYRRDDRRSAGRYDR
jgi:hypothetical protein